MVGKVAGVGVIEGYLGAAGQAAALLRRPEPAGAWEAGSALAGMSVGALAAHLAYQILSVEPTLNEPVPPGRETLPLLEHYARAAWIGAPLDAEANAGIRARAEAAGAGGPQAVWRGATDALGRLTETLPGRDGTAPVFLPQTGWCLTLDDFLATRLLELAVHLDDLATSVGVPTQDLPPEAFDPVLVLLARLAARRHGQPALLRALARAERAPAAVNAI